MYISNENIEASLKEERHIHSKIVMDRALPLLISDYLRLSERNWIFFFTPSGITN